MAKTNHQKEKSPHPHNPGSLGGEMRMRVKTHTKEMSNHTKSSYMRSCALFDQWRKEAGLSNSAVRKDPRAALEQWRDYLKKAGYRVSSIHTRIAGVCCGLGIDMSGIAKQGTAADKKKSLGLSERARKARERPKNAKVVRFQELVGGRRGGLLKLRGKDFVPDESGEWCVRFVNDKGGKTQFQRIAPEDQAEVRAYFDAVGPDELLFPEGIDTHIDLHGIRAERARKEYARYAKICSTPEGRELMRKQLWARYTDPEIGCKAYLLAKSRGEKGKMHALQAKFAAEMADGIYYLQRDNRKVAKERSLPVGYDRLALLATSVFSLSHWRSEVTCKYYML